MDRPGVKYLRSVCILKMEGSLYVQAIDKDGRKGDKRLND